jgi:hypothetical protein
MSMYFEDKMDLVHRIGNFVYLAIGHKLRGV